MSTSRSRSSLLDGLKSTITRVSRKPQRTTSVYWEDSEAPIMPGKSNTFDFTNRSNAGAKLGQIIGTKLQKEAEKVKKDAERQAAKARKQSNDSSFGNMEQTNVQIIDLKAPNKDLGDEGVCAMAEGMEVALRSGDGTASLALEDLNLSGNGITTMSLARLAPIVELAKFDLKTINLSGNSIRVESDEQAQRWESFLLAFGGCFKLRRLDLSDNAELGARALEILARVHTMEPAISPTPPGGDVSVLSFVSESDEGKPSDDDHVDSAAEDDEYPMKSAMLGGTFIKRRCGLRSIPYLTLHNIGLDDAGALWLSYVLDDHYYPSQLIGELNATNAESIIKTYQQDTHSRGLDWAKNESIGKDGLQLLRKTEAMRKGTLYDEAVALPAIFDIDDDDMFQPTLPQSRRGSLDKIQSRAQVGNRRASVRSIRTTDGGEHEATELESARKKIMRHIIGHEGSCSVELWSAAVQMFRASRCLLYISPSDRKYYAGEPLFPTRVTAPPTVPPLSPSDRVASDETSQLRIDTENAKTTPASLKASYASKLQSTSSTGKTKAVITEVTNTPTMPLRFQKTTHRKDAFSDGAAVPTINDKLDALTVGGDSPLRYVRHQQRKITASSNKVKIYRDRSTPSHLPVNIMERILCSAVSARELDVLGVEQIRKAIARGQDRSTLKGEMEWLKKDRSAQVLMLLDSISCLYYGQ